MITTARWRGIAIIAALSGLSAVILAALGAHVLPVQDANSAKLWQTALDIHMFHTAALLGIAALLYSVSSPVITFSAMTLVTGMVLFSGSLYLKAAGVHWLPGFIAPAGGLLLAAAWILLAIGLTRARNRARQL